MKHQQSGSSLVAVVIIAAALGIGVYSTLSLVQGEQKMSKLSAIYHEARLAAESILQQSMADLKKRFEIQAFWEADALKPGNNPLTIGSDFISRHTGSDSLSALKLPAETEYTSVDDFNTEPTEVIGGPVPTPRQRFIDRFEVGNRFDPDRGTAIHEQHVQILAKATVERPSIGTATVHARQTLQVRDTPIFGNAIFYNMDMEIAPSDAMTIEGPVHTNGDVYLQASNNGLEFLSKLTMSGNLYHGRHGYRGATSASNGPVKFPNNSGELINMEKDASWPSDNDTADLFSDNWLTSEYDDFLNLSNQLWNGNVQTEAHGILPQNPIGVDGYQADLDGNQANGLNGLNFAYQMIQPTLKQSVVNAGGQAQLAVEQQKYWYKAGLVIKINGNGMATYHTPLRARGELDGALLYDAAGNLRTRALAPSAPIVQINQFDARGGVVRGGLYDARQATGVNLIEMDVRRLKNFIHRDDENHWGGDADQKPSNWWNGVVYVEFPQQKASSTRPDLVNPATNGGNNWWGLRVNNGGTIPSPDWAKTNMKGMSLATNQMLYVNGHYNADGDMATGSPVAPDDDADFAKKDKEAPAALIADSITFLSPDWEDAKSLRSKSHRKATTPTEVSAAILTGLVPTGKNGGTRYSGGVENFPRFLEDWDTEIRIRGSMVALFESEVATRNWTYNAYGAPTRNWGFHQKYVWFQPPGSPSTRRYQAVDFAVVTPSEYEGYINEFRKQFSQ